MERPVAVDEADDAVVGIGGEEPGPAGRTEPRPGLFDDGGAGGPGDVAGAVAGAVVDDDRPVTGRHGGEEGRQGGRLVEDGDDHVGHGTVVSGPRLQIAAEVLTIR